jgi:NTP pyrophosphatase (non-canonical NTP hydrolase)
MEINEYQSQATRTLGDLFYPDNVTPCEMDAVLRQTTDWTDLVEQCKKSLFYGKDAPQKALDGLFRQKFSMNMNAEYPPNVNLLHGLLGIVGETSEVAQLTEKLLEGWDIDRERFINEIGDQIWYAAIALEALGSSLDEATSKNNTKLRERFPERFEASLALDKNENAEEMAMQGVS